MYYVSIKLTPHHYAGGIMVTILLLLAMYELKEYLGIKFRADSVTELICSPAQHSTSFAEFFCFFLYASEKRQADQQKYDKK